MNFDIIKTNLAEAAEELVKLQKKAADRTLSEEDFEVRLLYAYHHLAFTWNIRHRTTIEYANLTPKQFETWGKYPAEIEQTLASLCFFSFLNGICVAVLPVCSG